MVFKVDGTVSHRCIYKNLRLRLEYAYLLFNKFIMNRINSKFWIEVGFAILKVDGTVSQRCISKFKIEVRICIPAI